MQANALMSGHYLKPYAGGAGVALVFLDGLVVQAHIKDDDAAVAVLAMAS